jgi:hypothetical protein
MGRRRRRGRGIVALDDEPYEFGSKESVGVSREATGMLELKKTIAYGRRRTRRRRRTRTRTKGFVIQLPGKGETLRGAVECSTLTNSGSRSRS